MRASIHLGNAHLDEFEQLRIEAFGNPAFNGHEAVDAAVLMGHEVQTLDHSYLHRERIDDASLGLQASEYALPSGSAICPDGTSGQCLSM
jgi:hypothetical protein